MNRIEALRQRRLDPIVKSAGLTEVYSPVERTRIVYRLRWGDKERKVPVRKEARLLRRETVADRLACSRRVVDKLAVDGVLYRVMLPGRKRAAGFLESEVDAQLMGTSDDAARPV